MICRLFASTLISKFGLKKGDVVGLLLPNLPEYVFAIHGALEAGLTVTFVNPLYTPSKITYLLCIYVFIFKINIIGFLNNRLLFDFSGGKATV